MRDRTRVFYRLPVTVCMLVSILLVGIVTGTPTHALDPVLSKRWGFSLHDFWHGTWYALFTSIWLTNRPLMFWGILPFVGFSVGVYEWLAGARRTLWLFWITDLSGTLSVTLLMVLPLYLAGTSTGHTLAYNDDVGMSGGGFGCLGGWLQRLSGPWKTAALSIAIVYLVGRLVLFTDLFPDVVHILTFAGGYWYDKRVYSEPYGPGGQPYTIMAFFRSG